MASNRETRQKRQRPFCISHRCPNRRCGACLEVTLTTRPRNTLCKFSRPIESGRMSAFRLTRRSTNCDIRKVVTSRGEMLGVEGVQEIVRQTSSLLAEMKQGILDGVATWRKGPPTDDVSLMLVHVRCYELDSHDQGETNDTQTHDRSCCFRSAFFRARNFCL